MSSKTEEFGIVGLGKMGAGLAQQALDKGIRVMGFTLAGEPRDLVEAGLGEVGAPGGFRAGLGAPRAGLVYIPAGPALASCVVDSHVPAAVYR